MDLPHLDGWHLISLNSMGMLLMSRGRLAEAEGCLRAAVDDAAAREVARAAAVAGGRFTLPLLRELLPELSEDVIAEALRALGEAGGQYLVQFPNIRRPEFVPTASLFTRCDLAIPDPSVFLAARITETPLWQQRRAGFVHAATGQRRYSAGMTGQHVLVDAGIAQQSVIV